MEHIKPIYCRCGCTLRPSEKEVAPKYANSPELHDVSRSVSLCFWGGGFWYEGCNKCQCLCYMLFVCLFGSVAMFVLLISWVSFCSWEEVPILLRNSYFVQHKNCHSAHWPVSEEWYLLGGCAGKVLLVLNLGVHDWLVVGHKITRVDKRKIDYSYSYSMLQLKKITLVIVISYGNPMYPT